MDSVIFLDASTIGWGAHLLEISIGRWKKLEALDHINYLELEAAFLALRAFLPLIKGSHVQFGLDNCTAVAYINWLGGTRSQHLTAMALDIWCYALDKNMVMSAIHVPGKWNRIADGKSRIFHYARSQSVQTDNQTSGTLGCGSVCLSGKSSGARVRVMEVRTRGNSNRCFQYPLGLSTELFVSSFLPDTNVPKESNAGAGRLHSHCSSMEEPAMVSSTPIHAYRASPAIASGSENPEASRDRQDSSPLLPEEIPVSCMENFWKSLQNEGFPEKCKKFYYLPEEATQPSNMKVLRKAGVAGVVKKRLILFLRL